VDRCRRRNKLRCRPGACYHKTLAKVLNSQTHPAAHVDPFGARPCECETVTIHTTDGEFLGDDIAECVACGWKMTLAELYKDHAPPSLGPAMAGGNQGDPN